MKVIVYMFLILFSGFSVAQKNTASEKLLNEVIQNLKAAKNASINYSLNQNNQQHKGTIWLSKQKYVLEFNGVKQIFDGKQLFTIDTQDKEVTISKKGNSTSFSITELLQSFRMDYSVGSIKSLQEKSNLKIVEIHSKNKTSGIDKIELSIESNKKQIRSITHYFSNASKSVTTIESIVLNENLPENFFAFTKENYADYYLNYLN